MHTESVDVLIIGAGPAGAVAACLLRAQGLDVLVLEKDEFPRGDVWATSLLPQSMATLEEAGLLRVLIEAGYRHSNGVVFHGGGESVAFDFREKTASGWSTAYQLWRGDFDEVLAEGAEHAGAALRFCQEVVSLDMHAAEPRALVSAGQENSYTVRARFVIDASGHAAALPRLAGLEQPFDMGAARQVTHAVFELAGGVLPGADVPFDLSKSHVHWEQEHSDAVAWIRPLGSGRASIGVMQAAGAGARPAPPPIDADHLLRAVAAQQPAASWLAEAECVSPVSSFVLPDRSGAPLVGRHFVLAGHAHEWPDPALSSGLALALESARRAAGCVVRQLAGERVDWAAEYVKPLRAGAAVFRAHLGALAEPVFRRATASRAWRFTTTRQLCSVLAGYVWDDANPLAQPDAAMRLAALLREAESCAGAPASGQPELRHAAVEGC